MKLKDLRTNLADTLRCCSCEEAEFEADCMIADLIGVTNSVLRIMGDTDVAEETVIKSEEFALRRLNGEPLQYILGKWEFYGNSFYVGEGVLIPRPETELLVDISLDFLKDKHNPACIDLCSGSGCIGITVAKLVSDSDVSAFEKSDKALCYLTKNKELNQVNNLNIISGDIFDGPSSLDGKKFDIILSNPPYIRSEIIPSLQREVQSEPKMALDGGADGLEFYRVIAEKWISSLKADGLVAVEIGEEQGSDVSSIFSQYFNDVRVVKDYSGNDRVVIAENMITE